MEGVKGCKHCSNLPRVIGSFSAEGLLMCWTYVLIKRPHQILSRLSGEAVKKSQTVVVVTFGSAVCLNPPPDSCFTVVIQVCSLLSPSFNPSPLTPALHCSHSNAPARHLKLFLCSTGCSTVTAELLLVKLWLVGSFSRTTLLLFCVICLLPSLTTKVASEPTHSFHVLWAGRGGWILYPPPNCWNSKKQHTSELMLMWAKVRTKTASWMWPDLFIDSHYLTALLVSNGQQFQVQEPCGNPPVWGVQWSQERSLHGPFS